MHPLLANLIKQSERPCISVYLPIIAGASHGVENEKRLESILRECDKRLQSFDLSEKGRNQFLAPARAYGEEHLRNGVHGKTLALFFGPSFFMHSLLQSLIDPLMVVGSTFCISPLLQELQDGRHYYILAVSKQHAHLLEVSDAEASFKEVTDMPSSLADAWKGMEHNDESLQFHSVGGGAASFHGQGNAKDDEEMELKVYLQKIAKSLHTFLHEQHSPLVFAGVEELHGLYQHLDTSGKLLSAYIRGNPDRMDAKEILEKAEPIVRAALDAEHRKLLANYGPLAGTGRTSTDLAAILASAHAGKVELLLIVHGHADEPVNDAILSTLQHRGRVVVVDKDEMPEHAKIAAVLRL